MSNKQSSTQADYIVGLKGLQGKYICKMGSGDKVKLRLDPWVSTLSKYIPRLNPRYQNLAHLPVSYLTLPRFTRWNVNKIRQTFRPEDVHQILLLPPPSNDREDSSLWLPANNGVFLNL